MEPIPQNVQGLNGDDYLEGRSMTSLPLFNYADPEVRKRAENHRKEFIKGIDAQLEKCWKEL